MVFLLKWCSFGFLIELLGFPLVSPWFPIALLCIVCLLCSNRFLIAFPLFSYGFPDVSRWCSYDFLWFSNTCSLWFPIVFILPSHWFLIVSSWFLWFSWCFLWISDGFLLSAYGLLIVLLWFSNSVLLIFWLFSYCFQWCSYGFLLFLLYSL